MKREKQCEIEAKGYVLELRRVSCVTNDGDLASVARELADLANRAVDLLNERDAIITQKANAILEPEEPA
jgi:hypothetical protein